MKSGLRRAFRNKVPIPLANENGGTIFNLSDNRFSLRGGESLLNAYSVMSTVYSCVSLLSESVGRVEWKLFKKQPVDARRRYTTNDNPADNRTEVVRHAALSLISKPNPFYTKSRLFELDQTYLDLIGECYWVLDRGNGLSMPTAIWPVMPHRMEPVPSGDSFIAGWIYRPLDGSLPIPLSADEVIQVALPNPLDPLHGLGPVQSILVDIDASKYSAEWNRNFFINSATPYGVITTPNNLEDTEFKQLMDRWRESHRGISRTGRVGVLEAGQTFTPVGMSQKDMDFASLRNLSRDIVREAFRMHKVMLGVSDDVNRANAQTGEEVFASWCVVPRLDRKRDMLNNVLLPMFGATDVEFDYVTPVPTNREQDAIELKNKSTAAQLLVAAGYDPDDVLETVGLPAMGVVEKATQSPALPPAWVPAPPADPSSPPVPAARFTNKKDAAAKVIEQEAEDYPSSAMSWMYHASWSGPVTVPADHIDPDMGLMDKADPNHVEDFAKQIRKGKKVKPVVMVKTPGNPKPQLVDGHHRYLAAKQEGVPVRAYIGTVDAEHGAWEQMHDCQIDKPVNLAAAAVEMESRLRRVLSNGHDPVQLDQLRELVRS